MIFGAFDYSNILISILMSKLSFIKYLPLVKPKLIPKLKKLRMYWNLSHETFQICRSWFWCQKWFLVNIYHLLGLNWSQNLKLGDFIEVHNVGYFNNKVDLFTERSIAYLRNYKFKTFLTIFLPKSNVCFCRWFELYVLNHSKFFRAPLIKMCGFVFLNG